MKTEVYVKADIENILKALSRSVESLPANDYPEDMYRLGFATALQSVALAFGIEMATLGSTRRGVAEMALPVITVSRVEGGGDGI